MHIMIYVHMTGDACTLEGRLFIF